MSVATNEVYDLAMNKWTTARPMLTARNHPAGGVVNGKVYVIDAAGASKTLFDPAEKYVWALLVDRAEVGEHAAMGEGLQ